MSNEREELLLNLQEIYWRQLESRIVTDPASFWHGSLDPAEGNVTHVLSMAIPLYCHKKSSYYRSPELLMNIEAAVSQLQRQQLESGCVSLVNCNIDSPPDTGFTVHLVSLCCRLLEDSGITEAKRAAGALRLFLEGTQECLLTGGIHTPNHRWVICGALAMLYRMFGNEALRDRAVQYLNEGFDLTEYGEWTERSNAIYNSVCDLMLFHVGREFGHDASLQAVRRNLDMMPYLLHPDHTIVTEYSIRQDRAEISRMNGRYYTIYRLMAAMDRNPLYAAMADLAAQGDESPECELLYMMLYPELMLADVHTAGIPEQYTKLFDAGKQIAVPKSAQDPADVTIHSHGAAVLRHRDGPLSVTVMAGHKEFLYLQYGEARMTGIRLAVGWFGIGSVSFPSIRRTGDSSYRLEIVYEGSYRGPLSSEKAVPYHGSYVDMPNYLREKTHVTLLPVTVDLTIGREALRIDYAFGGKASLFVQAIASFDWKGHLEGDGLEEKQSHIYKLTSGAATYRSGKDWIRLHPGTSEHNFVTTRGDAMVPDRLNLMITSMSPLQRTIWIEYGGH